MGEVSREDRIEDYYHESTRDLAEWLVDAEDEIDMWKRVLRKAEIEIEAYKFGRRLPSVSDFPSP